MRQRQESADLGVACCLEKQRRDHLFFLTPSLASPASGLQGRKRQTLSGMNTDFLFFQFGKIKSKVTDDIRFRA